MLVSRAIRNRITEEQSSKIIDFLDLEWYESTKRIQRKKTRAGVEIALRFLEKGQNILDGDVLFEDEEQLIVINILATKSIVVKPSSLREIGLICYEIGNKHIPLFVQNDLVLLPYESPMFRWLEKNHYHPEIAPYKLTNRLNANVEHHKSGLLTSTLLNKEIVLKIEES